MDKKAIIVLTVIVLAVAAFFVFGNTGDNNNTTPSPTPVQTPAPVPVINPNPPVGGDVTINYTSTGYSPSTVTIKKGSKVTFVNQTTGQMWPASAPHPTHTDYPEFDPKKAVAAGESFSFTFDKTGTWRFHDHLFSARFGTITVTE
jgi:plastocyanin